VLLCEHFLARGDVEYAARAYITRTRSERGEEAA
jgi:hypothetical protein